MEEPGLKFLDFDLERVVRTGQRLMASEGREFDREEQVGAGGVQLSGSFFRWRWGYRSGGYSRASGWNWGWRGPLAG